MCRVLSLRLGSNGRVIKSPKMVRKEEGGRDLGEKREGKADRGRWRVPVNWGSDILDRSSRMARSLEHWARDNQLGQRVRQMTRMGRGSGNRGMSKLSRKLLE